MQSFDARTPLDELLDRCQLGLTIVITRRGHPVARLTPIRKRRDQTEIVSSVKKLRAFGQGIRLPKGLTIRDLIEEGRA